MPNLCYESKAQHSPLATKAKLIKPRDVLDLSHPHDFHLPEEVVQGLLVLDARQLNRLKRCRRQQERGSKHGPRTVKPQRQRTLHKPSSKHSKTSHLDFVHVVRTEANSSRGVQQRVAADQTTLTPSFPLANETTKARQTGKLGRHSCNSRVAQRLMATNRGKVSCTASKPHHTHTTRWKSRTG